MFTYFLLHSKIFHKLFVIALHIIYGGLGLAATNEIKVTAQILEGAGRVKLR